MAEPLTRWHVFFSGKVQAVGFRFTAQMFAKNLSLTGWVKNLDDGRVEMEVQGPVSKLRKQLLLLKSNPPIFIEDYQIREIPIMAGESGFRIKE